MSPCAACNAPNASPSPTVAELCSACWWRLPAAVRAAYRSGRLSVRRVGAKRRRA